MATESGYSNQKKKGSAQFKTLQGAGNNSVGSPVILKALYNMSGAAKAIVSVSEVLGSSGIVDFWKIQVTSHGASVGDVIRMITGTLIAWEFEVIEVVDANNFKILPISPSKPVAAETLTVNRWVTLAANAIGELSTKVIP